MSGWGAEDGHLGVGRVCIDEIDAERNAQVQLGVECGLSGVHDVRCDLQLLTGPYDVLASAATKERRISGADQATSTTVYVAVTTQGTILTGGPRWRGWGYRGCLRRSPSGWRWCSRPSCQTDQALAPGFFGCARRSLCSASASSGPGQRERDTLLWRKL